MTCALVIAGINVKDINVKRIKILVFIANHLLFYLSLFMLNNRIFFSKSHPENNLLYIINSFSHSAQTPHNSLQHIVLLA